MDYLFHFKRAISLLYQKGFVYVTVEGILLLLYQKDYDYVNVEATLLYHTKRTMTMSM